jgi:hypothetical protein
LKPEVTLATPPMSKVKPATRVAVNQTGNGLNTTVRAAAAIGKMSRGDVAKEVTQTKDEILSKHDARE